MASIRRYKNKGDKKFKYEYRIKYRDPITGKIKEKSKRGFSSAKEAELAALEVEKQLFIGNTDIVKNSEITVEEWINQYIEIFGPRLRKSTVITRKNHLFNHIVPALGRIKLQKLTKLQYQKFINQKLETFSESTVKSIHGTFMTVVNKAVENEIIDKNRLRGVVIAKDEDAKIKYLNREEIDIFMTVARTLPFDQYMGAFLLLWTGMRKGELLALTWDDVDFKNKLISITKNRNHLGTFPPKTKKSNRVISVSDKVIQELKKYKLWQKKNTAWKTGYTKTKYVLVDEYGVPYHEWKLNDIIEKICNKANLPRIGPHALRHTYAVMLLESGVDIKTVSQNLGHTKIDMTANVYLHVSRKQATGAAEKLEKYLEG